MLRRTQPNQGLPLVKLGTLMIRQMTKPMVGKLIEATKEHPAMLQMCVALGRLSMGSTGALRERAQIEEKRAEEQKEAVKAYEAKQTRKEEFRVNLREAAVQDATRNVDQRLKASEAAWRKERELLRLQIEMLMTRLEKGDSAKAIKDKHEALGAKRVEVAESTTTAEEKTSEKVTPKGDSDQGERKRTDGQSSEQGQQMGDERTDLSSGQTMTAATTKKNTSQSPKPAKKSLPHWSNVGNSDRLRSGFHKRFYDNRVPEAALRDGGAELLADLCVYLVMACIVLYEYNQSKINEQRKEDVQNARLWALESKVNELVGIHGESSIHALESIPPARLPFSFITWPSRTVRSLVGKPTPAVTPIPTDGK